MPLTIPYVDQTWADGSGGGTPISAARLAVMEAGIKAAHYMPAVRVTHSTFQTLATGVAAVLSFNTERYDQASNTADTMHDNTTNSSRLTCRYGGVYSITGMVEFASNATGFRQLQIRLNGSSLIGVSTLPSVAVGTQQLQVVADWLLAVNDYVELLAVQNSGGNLNVNSTSAYSPEFMMKRVA